MGNNKNCSNCKDIIAENDLQFCPNCGSKLIQNNFAASFQDKNNNVLEQDKKNNNEAEGNKLGIISLILYFLSPIIVSLIMYILPRNIRGFFSTIGGAGPLVGIIIMIVGRVKYPANKFLKIVMWIIIISIILGLLVMILIMVWFYITCSNMDTSGCG